MHLDFFDRKILDVLTKKDEPLTLAELVRDSGFARSTAIVHLERLGSEGLVLKEKKPSKGRGRPEFQYRPADAPQPKAAPQPSVVVQVFEAQEGLQVRERRLLQTGKRQMRNPKL
jgi:predicted transcriptional regulator